MEPVKWVSLPGCDVSVPANDIALRLSVSGSGWFINADSERRQVDSGDADALAASILKSAPQRHFALMVSSVLPGLWLGPALNLAVDALAKKRANGEDGHTLVRTDDHIAIVSRSHSLRDFLAESTLRFGSQVFPLMSFPTFRLKRNGDTQAARFGRNLDRLGFEQFTVSPRFLFYDLSPLHDVERVTECAIVLAELSESDGPHYVDRLMNFARICHARYVFPIISYHDVEKRRLLESLGFMIVTMTKGSGSADPDFTFSALAAATPDRTEFRVTSCGDPIETALAIDRAYRMLREMWKICGSNAQPRQLRRAWNLLDEMTAAPAAIRTLETVRLDAPGVTTIGFGLKKLARLDCDSLPTPVQGALNIRWPHMHELLLYIYKLLLARNPVAEAVIERIVEAKGRLTVMTRSDTAAAALKRDLLFDWEWNDEAGDVRIGSAASLCRERIIARNVVAVGFNPNSRPQLHWSALPERLEVVTYPHALTSLAEYEALLRRSVAAVIPKANSERLLELRGNESVNVTNAHVFELAYADLAALIAAFRDARRADLVARKDEPSALLSEDEIVMADFVAPETDQAPQSEPTAVAEAHDAGEGMHALIRMVDGSVHVTALTTTFAVLPADSEELVRLKAVDLSQGDRIVLLSEDEHRSVYALIAERTQHFFPIDDRALELWDASTERLRAEYPPEHPYKVDEFCRRLEAENCLRGRQSMRNWLTGRVFAPEALEDVELLLRIAGVPGDTAAIAKIVCTELDRYRNFRRTIGRAIARRTITRAEGRDVRHRLEEEIDEVLDLCDIREVESVDIDPAA
ncbi:MAG: hypothetical protein ACREMP_02110 [Candidatus Tyrphobacter sp.]